MFGFNQDGKPVVKVFSEGRNDPYVITSNKFPKEIKNILEQGEEETDTTNLLPSPENTMGRNVWVEEGGVKINISESAQSEVSNFLDGIYERTNYEKITLGINEHDQYVVRILGKGKIFYVMGRNGDVEGSKVQKTIKMHLAKNHP